MKPNHARPLWAKFFALIAGLLLSLSLHPALAQATEQTPTPPIAGSNQSQTESQTNSAVGPMVNGQLTGTFGYTGQVWLPELGLYYYKGRMYNPNTGRFMQTDPVGYDDQNNLYAYVGNDPVNARDPTGKRIVLSGTLEERNALRAAIRDVATSDRRLLSRYNGLRDSKNVHIVSFARGGQRSGSQPMIPANAENGRGTSTRNYIERNDAPLPDGMPNNVRSTIAHELFGHGFEADKGISDQTTDPANGIRNREVSATQAENIYREAAGMPVRERYGDRPVPRISKDDEPKR